MQHKWNYDCKSFPGTRACDVLKSEGYEDCGECKFYEPISKKILVIKLGAMGDVLRTTGILTALKKKYGEGCSITWLTNEESKDFFSGNPYVDRVWISNFETSLKLRFEKFDVLLSLEIDAPGSALANLVNAKEKYGYYFADNGHTATFNKNADYYLERAYSDYINRSNRKTYQQMIFDVTELTYNKEAYLLRLDDFDNKIKEEAGRKIGIRGKILGINVGSAGRWSNKSWSKNKIIDFIKRVKKETDYNIMILGGKRESNLMKEINDELKKDKIEVYSNDSNNSLREFINVVNLCDVVVCGDTLALHIALALEKKTIGLFLCTPPWEIEDLKNFKKITSNLLENYFYSDGNDEELVNSISVDEVLKAVKEF